MTSTLEYPIAIPEQVLRYCTKYESSKSLLDIYTKYNRRAKLAIENLIPVLNKYGMNKVDKYLDIGCGNGAVSALVAKTLKAQQIYLIDGDGTVHRTTGFTPQGTAWNDVQVAMVTVRANVEKNVVVAGMLANQPTYDLLPDQIGLITSFRSWGHHYHIDTYIQIVRKYLLHGGFIVLDIRHGTNGVQQMKKYGFRCLEPIPDQSKKCLRALFTNA